MKKITIVTVLLISLTACGGGGSGPASDTSSFAISCVTSGTDLHGCWQSSCELMDGGVLYGLYIVSFLSSGDYSTHFRLYQNASCVGSPFSQADLLNDTYTTGVDVMTTNGTTATELNLEYVGFSGFSIYEVTLADELCLPDPDYNWSPTGGGLSPLVFTESFRPDTIDYTNCLSRFTS